jgi:hypothetical protein
MARTNNNVIMLFSIGMFILLIVLLVLTYNSKCRMGSTDRFDALSDAAAAKAAEYKAEYDPTKAGPLPGSITAFAPPSEAGFPGSDPLGNSFYMSAEDGKNDNMYLETQVAGSCVNRDRLTSADLLPLDANSKWAELNPQCPGDLQDQNYLTAGYHIGINTVGQSMRNANLQLRAEPPNPQIQVSPWLISTIEPDTKPSGLSDIGTSSQYS